MKEYGVPYMGSKSKIADSLLKALPEGKRFVDLFGGGFAMSECALRSGKYEMVYYNDINPLIANLVMDSIKGKYNFSRFDAKWVDRETFHREKEKDGFIKYIWSFGNDGDTYFCGKDADEWKKKAYEFVVFGKKDPELAKAIPGILKIKDKRIHDRRLAFQKEAKAIGMTENSQRIAPLERMQRLQQLESLQRLEAIQRLEFHTGSYENYVHEEGDVVYCDIPYEGTAEYSGGFDHKKFYAWVDAQPYPIYISSYRIKNTKWRLVWAKCKTRLMTSKADKSKPAVECLYKSK